MTRKQFIEALERREACDEALAWVRKTKGTPTQLWEKCCDAIWMTWLVDCSGPRGGDGVCTCTICMLHDFKMSRALFSTEIRAAVPWELVEAFLAADYDGGGR